MFSLFILSLFAGVASAGPTTTSLFATIEDTYYDFVSSLLPDGYNLPTNIYEWNMTDVANQIEISIPGFLSDPANAPMLTAIFPVQLVSALPDKYLISLELYCYLNETHALYVESDDINCNTTEQCWEPFMETRHDTYFKFDTGNGTLTCGLECKYKDFVWGYTESDYLVINSWLLTSTIIFVVIMTVVWVNHCLEIHTGQDIWYTRPFLFQTPICLSFWYTIWGLLFLLPFIAGKDEILCADDVDGLKSVSNKNPGGGNSACTAFGAIWYLAQLLAGSYTVAFSFQLWVQMYSPLHSLWSDFEEKWYCFLCSRWVNCVCNSCRCLSRLSPVSGATLQKESRRKKNKIKRRKSAREWSAHVLQVCSYLFCTRESIKHYVIWSFSCICIILVLGLQMVNSYSPLGLCTVGGRDDSATLAFQIVPCTVMLVTAGLFLPAALVLLVKVAARQAGDNVLMHQLGVRLLVYFLCIEFAWGVAVVVAQLFYQDRHLINQGAEERLYCLVLEVATGDVDSCYEEGYVWDVSHLVLSAIPFPMVAIGSLFLTCHAKNLKFYKKAWQKSKNYVLALVGHPEAGGNKGKHNQETSDIESEVNTTTKTTSMSPPNAPPNCNREKLASISTDVQEEDGVFKDTAVELVAGSTT